MIDHEGYRANVGIIITNDAGQVFWGKRAGQTSWQFPQGGIHKGESPEQALYRELEEEVGLREEHVEILGRTHQWLRYQLPERFVRRRQNQRGPVCIGQKQLWFLLRLSPSDEQHIRFDATEKPEFDGWRWVSYLQPSTDVVYFKREVYRRAMLELAPLAELDSEAVFQELSKVELALPDDPYAVAKSISSMDYAARKSTRSGSRSGLRYMRRHLRR